MTTQAKPLLRKVDGIRNLLSDNSGIQKGMEVFRVSVWSRDEDSKKVTVGIRKLTIESFGKQKGTATENGTFLKHNLSPRFDVLATTMEDAKEMAKEIGLHESARDIEASLRCAESWMQHYAPRARGEVVERFKRKIAYLRLAQPSTDLKTCPNP